MLYVPLPITVLMIYHPKKVFVILQNIGIFFPKVYHQNSASQCCYHYLKWVGYLIAGVVSKVVFRLLIWAIVAESPRSEWKRA